MKTSQSVSPLRAARLDAGLTPESAAKRLEISAEYLRKIERGQVALTEKIARRCAREYGGRIDRFFARTPAGGTTSGLGTRPITPPRFAIAKRGE